MSPLERAQTLLDAVERRIEALAISKIGTQPDEAFELRTIGTLAHSARIDLDAHAEAIRPPTMREIRTPAKVVVPFTRARGPAR